MSVPATWERLDAAVQSTLEVSRVPGAAIAIVKGGEIVFAKGYGYRDLHAKLPLSADTAYPIASTTKAINATMIGMLVDEGLLAWDAPVQEYLPTFRLWDAYVSAHVTLRDLLTMRTGLPRHDWLWVEHPIERADLVRRLRHLDASAGFREKFQYNNLTTTAAGHIAEHVTGRRWEQLVQEKILDPLGMDRTKFTRPADGNVTLTYHENAQRQVVLAQCLDGLVTAPSGGAIYSTVSDMARWAAFNLAGGQVAGRQLIQPKTLAEIRAPQVVARTDPSCPAPHATYGMGWFIYSTAGHVRISHGGYHHDVNSEVALFPDDALGIVSFVNFGPSRLSKAIGLRAFELVVGVEPEQTLEEELALYEKRIVETRERNAAVKRVADTSPSHRLQDYAGAYEHLGYGRMEICCDGAQLILKRYALTLRLRHWHYDCWVCDEESRFSIHTPHAFDLTGRMVFETSADGEICAFSAPLEPAAPPIRFVKQRT